MKKRFLVAIPLVFLMISVIFIRSYYFNAVIMIIALIIQVEMIKAMRSANFKRNGKVSLVFLVLMYPAHHFYGISAVFMLFFLMNVYNLVCSVFLPREQFLDTIISSFTLCYPALLVYSLIVLGSIKPVEYSNVAVAIALISPVVTDAGALFIGTKFGKTKLAPRVSPTKTVEGAVGGFFTSLIVTGLIMFIIWRFDLISSSWAGYENIMNIKWYHIILCTAICSIFGQTGDLVASSIKRFAKIKDFSRLFPGHGGMLDRMDSIIFSATAALIYFQFILLH